MQIVYSIRIKITFSPWVYPAQYQLKDFTLKSEMCLNRHRKNPNFILVLRYIVKDFIGYKILLLKLDSNSGSDNKRISTSKIFINGTFLALIIALPAIVNTVLFHYVLKTNLIITISAGVITLFVAMGFAYKISKRLSM